MTLVALGLLLATEPAPPAQAGFGRTTTAEVRGVDPDADPHRGDGAYGRFDGDLDFGIGAGASTYFTSGDLGASLRASAHWYSTAGLYLGYSESLGASTIDRRAGAGIELEPLFLLRWSQALESGPAILDLTLDSLSLGVGYLLLDPPDRGFGAKRGVELSLGIGMPLSGTASGPWLEARGGWYLPESGREASVLLFLSFHFHALSPVVGGE